MKCILHVGTEKTASSTIQAFLELNRKLLKSHGVLFPKSVGSPNNRGLYEAACSPLNPDRHVQSIGLRTPSQIVNHQKKIIKLLQQEVSEAKQHGVNTIVFSSEQLHSMLRTKSELERLQSILASLEIIETSVIIYLREPSELASSLYNTAILYGGRTTPPPRPGKSKAWDNMCNHKESILRWSSVFHSESIKPRLFAQNEFIGNHIVFDFLATAEINLPIDKLAIPDRRNESLSEFGLEVLRRINTKQPVFTETGYINPIRKGLPELFASTFKHGQKYMLPQELAEEYRTAYEPSNEWVKKHYFPERNTLYLARTVQTDTRACLNDQDLNDLASLVNALLENNSIKTRSILLAKDIARLALRDTPIRIKSFTARLTEQCRQQILSSINNPDKVAPSGDPPSKEWN